MATTTETKVGEGTIMVDDTNNQIEVQEDVMLGAYQLSLCASFRNLFRVSSSYASVKVVGGPYQGKDLGETECIPRSSQPDWCKTFFLDFLPGDGTLLLIEVWDDNNGSSYSYKIGSATIKAEDVEHHTELNVLLSGKGNFLTCRIEKSMIGKEKGDFAFQLRGLDMNNKEPGPFGLGRSDPFYEISKINSDHVKREDAENEVWNDDMWNAVYRSKHVNNHLNPLWEEAQLGLPELCFGDLTWPIKISVYDYNNNGNHVLMGHLLTCVEELQQKISIRGNADRNQALPIVNEIKGHETNTGYLCVLKASMVPPGERNKAITSARKKKKGSDGGGGAGLSSWLGLGILIFVVFLPLLFGLLATQEEKAQKVDTTPETTVDSYYLDYERDLNVTLRDGIASGYLASHHATDPQSLALDWLTTQDGGSNITTNSTSYLLQRYAMAVFYYAMDGDNSWNQNTTFLSSASVCEWGSDYGDGVTCNGAGQVTSIRLFGRGLNGPLPSELSLLFALRGLYLSRNNITRIPARIGSLKKLEDLYLSRNQLSGGIPESLAKLRNLESLHLQYNPFLTGDLDPLCKNVARKSNFYGAADCKNNEFLICSCCRACTESIKNPPPVPVSSTIPPTEFNSTNDGASNNTETNSTNDGTTAPTSSPGLWQT